MLSPADFFDLSKTSHAGLYDGVNHVWEVLKKIPDYAKKKLREIGPGMNGRTIGAPFVDLDVFIGEGTVVEHGAMIMGPTIIGRNCEIRKGAYIRGNVILGDKVVVGNSCEVKNALFHDEANVPHFAYVGDSVLGWKAHLGAGVKISNFKINRTMVSVKIGDKTYETGLRKFGCIMGDESEIGCNCVINPGTLIGKRVLGVSSLSISGYIPPESYIKLRQEQEITRRRDAARPAAGA
ncbi:MAG: hypothetical protein V1809_16010 [Planctomycetota bacterium]